MRSAIFPSSPPSQPTGSSAFRFTIATDKLAADPALSRFAPTASRPTMRLVLGPDMRIVMYPCRRGELLNVVCVHANSTRSDPDSGGDASTWHASSSVTGLTSVYASFAPVFTQLFAQLHDADVKLWQLLERAPLPAWVLGNVALLGDACHPMLPHQGQGASQAIEDGAALGTLFPRGTAAVDVPARLALYEHVRKARAESVQAFSKQAVMGADTTPGLCCACLLSSPFLGSWFLVLRPRDSGAGAGVYVCT